MIVATEVCVTSGFLKEVSFLCILKLFILKEKMMGTDRPEALSGLLLVSFKAHLSACVSCHAGLSIYFPVFVSDWLTCFLHPGL